MLKLVLDALGLLFLHSLLEFGHLLLLLLLVGLELENCGHSLLPDFTKLLLSVLVFLEAVFVGLLLLEALLLADALKCLIDGVSLLLLALLEDFNVCLDLELGSGQYLVEASALLLFSDFALEFTLDLHGGI